MQLEIPLKVVRQAIDVCRRAGVYTILDPAPVPEKGLARAMHRVDLLTPNQTEAQMLLGRNPSPPAPKRRIEDPKQLAGALLRRGTRSVVLKLAGRGALLASEDGFVNVRGFGAKVVDTTAAGDAFTAALAVARAEQWPLEEAIRFANAAGAICCEQFGAQPSLPGASRSNRS